LFDQQLATAASAGAELLNPSPAVGQGGPGTGVGGGAAAATTFPSFPVNSKLFFSTLVVRNNYVYISCSLFQV